MISGSLCCGQVAPGGGSPSWHPLGDGIPRFSPIHCSTGSVLLTQALLTCDRVRLYGYHACSCQAKCASPHISARNHYWDKKETPRFGEMMARYEHHMYARLMRARRVRRRRRHACTRTARRHAAHALAPLF